MSSKSFQVPAIVRCAISEVQKALDRGWGIREGTGELVARFRREHCPVAFRIGRGRRHPEAEEYHPVSGMDRWEVPVLVWFEGVRMELAVDVLTQSGQHTTYTLVQACFYDTWPPMYYPTAESEGPLPDEILVVAS